MSDQPPVYYNTAAIISCTPIGDCWHLGPVSAQNGDYHHKCWSTLPDLDPCTLTVRENIGGGAISTKHYKFACAASEALAGGVERVGGGQGTTVVTGYYEVT